MAQHGRPDARGHQRRRQCLRAHEDLRAGAVFDGTTPASPTLSIPAGHTMEIGPFPPALYNDANGAANVTYSQVASVTVLVRQLGT